MGNSSTEKYTFFFICIFFHGKPAIYAFNLPTPVRTLRMVTKTCRRMASRLAFRLSTLELPLTALAKHWLDDELP